MIHYQLQCDQAHHFDGWFKDSQSFDRQADTGLVTCPVCNSAKVTRALMAPALGRGRRDSDEAPKGSAPIPVDHDSRLTPSGPVGATAGAILENGVPDNIRALLQRLRSEVEKSFDYVGPDFAEEARRIHHGESEARGIYGETTRTEAEALADEGIEFGVLPWLPRSDS